MPKKAKEERKNRRNSTEGEDYVKAAAWAWYQHGAGAPFKFLQEYDAQSRQPPDRRSRPSRFQIEASKALAKSESTRLSSNSFDGFRSFFTGTDRDYHGFESEEEDTKSVGGSSLFDPYEIVALSRQLETTLSSVSFLAMKSTVDSEKSWMDRGISNRLLNDQKKRMSVGSGGDNKKKSSVVKHRWTPAMCSSTDVVVPGMIEGPRRSHSHSKSKRNDESRRSPQKLHEVLGISWPKTPHEGNVMRPSSLGNFFSKKSSDLS